MSNTPVTATVAEPVREKRPTLSDAERIERLERELAQIKDDLRTLWKVIRTGNDPGP